MSETNAGAPAPKRRSYLGVLLFVAAGVAIVGAVTVLDGGAAVRRGIASNDQAAVADRDAEMEARFTRARLKYEAEETAAKIRPNVTLAAYGQLQTGMTYAEAAEILNAPGVEQSSSEIAGIRTAMYGWRAGRGMGNMNAIFQNGRLVSKAQFGLE